MIGLGWLSLEGLYWGIIRYIHARITKLQRYPMELLGTGTRVPFESLAECLTPVPVEIWPKSRIVSFNGVSVSSVRLYFNS